MTYPATGIESLIFLEINWGRGGTTYRYGDKTASPSILPYLLEINGPTFTGKVNQSGVSRTCSIILDDTAGTLKTLSESLVLEKSPVVVKQRLMGSVSPAQDIVLFHGEVSGDIIWREGDRTLSFSVEVSPSSAQLREIGFTPASSAFPTLAGDAAGQPWPLCFGTVKSIPAACIEHPVEATLATKPYITKTTPTYEIAGGADFPQDITIQINIADILFEGMMDGEIFTPSAKNVPKYTDLAIGPREEDEDEENSAVFWLDASGIRIHEHYVYLHVGGEFYVNKCISQNGKKCYFSRNWGEGLVLDDDFHIDEVAKFPRTAWASDYEVYNDRDNIVTIVRRDGWRVKYGAPVIYISSEVYESRYVCNLIPSDAILEVYGKRTFFGKEIWSKVPSSYYSKVLSDTIVVYGTTTLHPTTLKFAVALTNIPCEGWTGEILVSLTSSVNDDNNKVYEDEGIHGDPYTICKYVVENYTSLTFDTTSDKPAIPLNFAYFSTTDALTFLEQMAYQAASVIMITRDNKVRLVFLPQEVPIVDAPVVDCGDVLMKSVDLSNQTIEDIATKYEAKYVTNYSGRDSATCKVVIETDIAIYGLRREEHDYFAITDGGIATAIAAFWARRRSKSWRRITLTGFADQIVRDVFDIVKFDVVECVNGIHGQIEEIVNDSTPVNFIIKAALASPIGSSEEDTTFWQLGDFEYSDPSDGLSEIDYEVPLDDSCTIFLESGVINHPTYEILITNLPKIPVRYGMGFTITAEIMDKEGVRVAITTAGTVHYVTPHSGNCHFKKYFDPLFVAGVATITFPAVRGSKLAAPIKIRIYADDRRIRGSDGYNIAYHRS